MLWDESTVTLTIQYEDNPSVPTSGTNVHRAINVFVESGFKTVVDYCFSNYKSMKYLTLPDSIETLGNNFLYASSIIECNIPLNFKEVTLAQPFDNQYTLEKVTVKKEHDKFTTFDDALYSKDMKTLVYYPGGKKDKIFFIPQGVENIGDVSITFSQYLEEIVIPPSVNSIRTYFCYTIKSLKKVTIINHKSNLNWNLNKVFSGTNYTYDQVEWREQEYLYSLTNSSSQLSVFVNEMNCSNKLLVSFNDNKFKGNTHIESITFGRGISTIEGDCFNGNTKLSSISFPDTIVSIDPKAFANCKSLRSYSCIHYPRSILSILRPVFNPYLLGLTRITCRLCRNNINIVHIYLIILQ